MSTEAKPAAAAPKYTFKNGAASMNHPFYKGEPITVEHLNGKDGHLFSKAIKHLDALEVKAGKAKAGDGWFERHIAVK